MHLDIFVSEDQLHLTKDRVLWTDVVKTNEYVLSDYVEYSSYRYMTDNNLMEIKILAHKYKHILKINFMTLSELLARIGAIVQNILTFFMVTNYLHSYWSNENYHFNEIFSKIAMDGLRNEVLSNSSSLLNNTKINLIGKNIDNIDNKDFNIKNYTNLNTNYDKIKTDNNNNILKLNNQLNNNIDRNNVKIYENKSSLKNNYEDKNNITNKNLNSDFSYISSNNIASKLNANNINNFNKLTNNKNNNLNNENEINLSNIFNLPNMNTIEILIKDLIKEKKLPDLKNKNLDDLKNDKKLYQYSLKKTFKEASNNKQATFSFCNYLFNKYFFCLYSFWIFNICTKRYKKNLPIFNYIDSYLDKSLEVSNIEKAYFQNNMLKYALFDNNQLEAFENIPLTKGLNIIDKINSIYYKSNLSTEFYDNISQNNSFISKKLYKFYA